MTLLRRHGTLSNVMDIILLLFLIPLIAGVLLVLFVFLRKIPTVRVMNVESHPEQKARRTKDLLILQRLSKGRLGVLVRLGQGVTRAIRDGRRFGRRLIHRLRAMEESYRDQKRHEGAAGLSSDVQRLMSEASDLVKEEQFAQAEKRYIEIISHHPKLVEAYEYLGRLYGKMKQLDQAVEALNFAAKLAPLDASVQASLGEVYLLREQWTKALSAFQRAVDKRPGNPKYLDGLIESALGAGKVNEAVQGLKLLKQANPENAKIEDFQERLIALRNK